MGESLVISYYARGSHTFLPFTDSDRALRYIAKRKPDFIVLLEGPKRSLPYTAQWFDETIPDARAKLIYDQGGADQERIKIYRWVNEYPAR